MKDLIQSALSELAIAKPSTGTLIAETPAALATVVTMIATYNEQHELAEIEIRMIREACRQLNVTLEEFERGYWKAYADRYTGKRMTFRAVWAHIQPERDAATGTGASFTFPQVLAWLEKRSLPLDYTPFFDFHPAGSDKPKRYTLKPGSELL